MKKPEQNSKWKNIIKKISLFQERSNENVLDLIFGKKMKLEDIVTEFKKYKVYITEDELWEYKTVVSNPFSVADKMSIELWDYLTTELGQKQLSLELILNSIIFVGYARLKDKQNVSIKDLLKAIELKKQMSYDVGYKNIEKEINELLRLEESNEHSRQDK